MMKVFEYLPELEGEELQYIGHLIEDMSEDRVKLFSTLYRARRRDPVLLLILALLGLFGVAGIHRFFVGHVGMGILYFFTAGLCFIGTIVDMINYKNFAFEYNRQKAQEIVRDMD
ncbi:MAG: TM2 domain-containing protein [Balneolaceae bacterium]